MATRNMLYDGDKGLTKTSRKVTDFNKRLHILLDDMRETLIEANGLGLAAPQVGVLRRVALIVDVTAVDDADGGADVDADVDEANEFGSDADGDAAGCDFKEQIIELVNPEIICSEGEQTGSEGCLSVPGVYGIVTRPDVVKVRAQDRHGEFFELEVSELTARAVCHEVDHLDGVLFTSIAERFLTEEEFEELRSQAQDESNDVLNPVTS